jgi:crotonobetainyl-CoA:carnitine CoA-transferase CaiB-like acyl-CoA transferase
MTIEPSTTPERSPRNPPENQGALAGIKVVDLTTARSGPTCVRQLVDLGAEALRVCKPGHVEATPNGMMTLVSHRLVGGSPIDKS